MAAAVLGHAARRLGGSGALRQTQESAVSSAVSSAVKRRFAHTEVQHPCTCGKFEKDAVLNRIQMQKENLYDAMTAANKTYPSVKNGALLRELSDHVNRSSDPTWESAQTAQLKQKLLKATGFVTMFAGGCYLYRKMLEAVFG